MWGESNGECGSCRRPGVRHNLQTETFINKGLGPLVFVLPITSWQGGLNRVWHSQSAKHQSTKSPEFYLLRPRSRVGKQFVLGHKPYQK